MVSENQKAEFPIILAGRLYNTCYTEQAVMMDRVGNWSCSAILSTK